MDEQVCGYEWSDGWGDHKCEALADQHVYHLCWCDTTTRNLDVQPEIVDATFGNNPFGEAGEPDPPMSPRDV